MVSFSFGACGFRCGGGAVSVAALVLSHATSAWSAEALAPFTRAPAAPLHRCVGEGDEWRRGDPAATAGRSCSLSSISFFRFISFQKHTFALVSLTRGMPRNLRDSSTFKHDRNKFLVIAPIEHLLYTDGESAGFFFHPFFSSRSPIVPHGARVKMNGLAPALALVCCVESAARGGRKEGATP